MQNEGGEGARAGRLVRCHELQVGSGQRNDMQTSGVIVTKIGQDRCKDDGEGCEMRAWGVVSRWSTDAGTTGDEPITWHNSSLWTLGYALATALVRGSLAALYHTDYLGHRR